MTSNGSSGGAVEAGPHHLSNHGCDFSVYLEPNGLGRGPGRHGWGAAGHDPGTIRARSGQIHA
jgi:hypothetical protein